MQPPPNDTNRRSRPTPTQSLETPISQVGADLTEKEITSLRVFERAGFEVGPWPPTTRSAPADVVSVIRVRDQEDAKVRLVEAMKTARFAAGNPTLRELGTATGYSESMMSRALSGKVLPSYRLVSALAEVLGIAQRTLNTTWLPLWQAACATPADTTTAGPTADDTQAATSAALPPGFECSECGAWVINGDKHLQWHLRIEGRGTDSTVSHLRVVE